MAEMQGIFADAKKNRFSSINALSDDGKLNDIDKTKLYKQQYQPRTLVEHQGLSFTYIGKHNRISHTKVRGQTQNIIMKVDRDKLFEQLILSIGP